MGAACYQHAVQQVTASPADALDVLEEVFGFPEFRAGQREAVDSAMAGRDTVVLLPTGAGKSLCYQVPALVASRAGLGTTVVVSPLIALMSDQVSALCGRGVRAAALNSHQDEVQRMQTIARFRRGDIDLLYVSPERAALPSFKRMLQSARIALIAIDEAHCVSQWGHDFRPEYLRLGELREVVDVPTIALTATATPQVMDELIDRLALRDPTLVLGDFARPNLSFEVRHVRTDAARIAAAVDVFERCGLRRSVGGGRAIVYCTTRKKTEKVAKELKAAGFGATHYHAGRTKLARERAQRGFELGRTRILVATNAFGMGIDLPDVRVIVHFQTPGSLEAYYQEAGRAGRDGLPAHCLMFFGAADLMTQRRLQTRSRTSAAMEQRASEAIAAIERYANSLDCRQRVLCGHFTGTDDHHPCGLCDVCVDEPAVRRALENVPTRVAPTIESLPEDAKQAITSAVGRLRRPAGKSNLAKALRGSRAKSLSRGGLLQLAEHGALSDYNEASIVAAIDELIDVGTLQKTGRKYPTVWLAGRPVRAPRTTGGATAGDKPKRPRRPRYSGLTRELENFRKRQARALKWKAYMVFQRRVIVAIDEARPDSLDALGRIPGLGPAKIDRFGYELLDIVRRNPRS